MTMLTEHFSMAEFTASETAARRGIDNTPNRPDLRANIQRTAQVLERIRELLGKPISLTSGYRCSALNAAVGGSLNSAHMLGLAADIIVPQYGVPYDVCRAIVPYLAEFGIDQLIYEHTWTHIGLSIDAPRHQVLTLVQGGYVQGIVFQGLG